MMMSSKKFERNRLIADRYRNGNTLQQIGDEFNISRQAVLQIIRKYTTLTRFDGGAHVRGKQQETLSQDKRCIDKYGCTYDEYLRIADIGNKMLDLGYSYHKTPRGSFSAQKRGAKQRGIRWNFKLAEWWKVWEESGKWHKRGTDLDDFVMCRHDDEGPYASDNVYIGTTGENAMEYGNFTRLRRQRNRQAFLLPRVLPRDTSAEIL